MEPNVNIFDELISSKPTGEAIFAPTEKPTQVAPAQPESTEPAQGVAPPRPIDLFAPAVEQTPAPEFSPPTQAPADEPILEPSVSAPAGNPPSDVVEGEMDDDEFYESIAARAEKIPFAGGGNVVFTPGDRRAIAAVMDALLEPEATEVILNAPDHMTAKRGGKRKRLDARFDSVDAYHHFINEAILGQFCSVGDKRIEGEEAAKYVRRPGMSEVERVLVGKIVADFICDDIVEEHEVTHEDVEAPARSRVHIMCPPFTETATVTFAKKSRVGFDLPRMVAKGTMTLGMADFLATAVECRANIAIAGPSGSGKTTLLQALTEEIAHGVSEGDELSYVLIEDSKELLLPKVLGARPVGFDDEITDENDSGSLSWVIKQATRMRPDGIILGEVIGNCSREISRITNLGISGLMWTMHATSARDTLKVLVEGYGAADDSQKAAATAIARTLDFVVHIDQVDGVHRITEIVQVGQAGNDAGIVPAGDLYRFDETSGAFQLIGRLEDAWRKRIASYGYNPDELEVCKR